MHNESNARAQRRDQNLVVRVARAERRALEHAAMRADLTLSAFVRAAALRQARAFEPVIDAGPTPTRSED